MKLTLVKIAIEEKSGSSRKVHSFYQNDINSFELREMNSTFYNDVQSAEKNDHIKGMKGQF